MPEIDAGVGGERLVKHDSVAAGVYLNGDGAPAGQVDAEQYVCGAVVVVELNRGWGAVFNPPG